MGGSGLHELFCCDLPGFIFICCLQLFQWAKLDLPPNHPPLPLKHTLPPKKKNPKASALT